jgi:hypothetical protein
MAQDTVKAIPLSVFDSGDLTGNYQAINPGGIPNMCFYLRICNDSNENITISYDGVNDHEFIPSLLTFDLPTQTNSQPNARLALFKAFTTVYVKGSAGSGNITLSGYYV